MEISIVIIVIASVLITFILDQIFKKKRYIKYFASIVMISVMIYYFITMYSASNEGFESLGKFVMGIFVFTASISSIGYSVFADVLHKKRTIKNNPDKLI